MQKLTNIHDNNPFKTPDKYFEELNRKIISATSGYNQESKKRGFSYRFKPYLLIAASVTAFIILGYSAIKLLTPDRINSQVSDIKYNEYNESYINDIDILTLEENAALLVLSEEGADVNRADIIDYLMLENIEINEIIEQL